MNSNPAIGFEPALTKNDLTVIQDRNADSPDIHVLLWEMTRLRALTIHPSALACVCNA
jgi:hypothetical protein